MKRWLKLLDADCRVLKVKNEWVYPIFKNAFTSLETVSEQEIFNEEISQCQSIVVFLRNQEQRFVTGVGEYLDNSNNMNRSHTVNGMPEEPQQGMIDKILDGQTLDRHFCPQAVWLLHLYKYFQGTLIVKDMSQAKHYTPLMMKAGKYKNFKLKAPEFYLSDDRKLEKYIGKKVNIGSIVKEFADVLP